MSSKICPVCAHQLTLKEFMRIRAWRFDCPGCGVELHTDLRRQFLAILVQTPILVLPISQGFRHPFVWLFVPVAVAVAFFIQFGFVKVLLWEKEQAKVDEGRPT